MIFVIGFASEQHKLLKERNKVLFSSGSQAREVLIIFPFADRRRPVETSMAKEQRICFSILQLRTGFCFGPGADDRFPIFSREFHRTLSGSTPGFSRVPR